MFLAETRQRDLDFAGLDSWPGRRSDAMAPETEPADRRMGKAMKPAAELEAIILSKMQTLSECPSGMTVTVKRRGETWEAVTMSPNHVAHADCVARVARYTAVLRTEYAFADEVMKTKK